jgi:DNA-binding beta-propeller fold protein YncE
MAALAAMALSIAACGSEATGRLYVASGLTDLVLVLDAETGAELDSIPVERRRDEVDEPHGLASSPDGRHWYATVSHGEPTLWKFESGSDRLVGRVTLPTGGAARIGITPDSRRAFVPDYDRSNPGAAGRLAVVDLETLTVVAAPEVCPGPHHAAVSPDGTLVAVACSLSDEIVILDAVTLELRGRFFVDAEPGVAGEPRFKPLNLAWAPDGSVVYASLHLAAQLRAFTVSGEKVGAADVGAGPAQIEITPDGERLVSANRGDESLSILSTAPLEETARIELGAPHPHGLALDERGRRAFVTCEGDVRTQGRVVAVDLTTGRPLWSVQAGAYLLGVLYR